MNVIDFYNSIPLRKIKIDDVSIGLRQVGNGPNMVFIHGFPTHGYTWRKIIPQLSEKFTCHILDLPGLGDSNWSENTNFKSSSQAKFVIELLADENINNFSLIAHNSGATIARAIAIQEKEKVENLYILNTEIPNHRPPWIPFYQTIGLLPAASFIVRKLFTQNWFIKSAMALKELYSNKSMLNERVNIDPYIEPLLNSKRKTLGAFKYLKGIDWQLIDDFKNLHKTISANVLFLWGEDDKTFPIQLGKEMVNQFTSTIKFVTIKNASLLPHEEKPDEIIKEILLFIGNSNR